MKVLVGSSIGRANKDFDSEYQFKLATNALFAEIFGGLGGTIQDWDVITW